MGGSDSTSGPSHIFAAMRRACATRGCPKTVEGPEVRCERHQLEHKLGQLTDIQPRTGRNRARRDQALRRQVLERDRQCLRCGNLGPLAVHHLNGDPHDNRLVNLVALCQGCHRDADREVRDRRRDERKSR